MRIGVLTFAADPPGEECPRLQERLVGPLSVPENRVVAGESVVSSGLAAAKESERIGNADCDAVLFLVCRGAAPDLPAQASLRVNAPILLICLDNAALGDLFAAAGMLQEAGIPHERLVADANDDAAMLARITRWLAENTRDKRHRGEVAAQKLYGMRCGAFGGLTAPIDTAQWLSQFGVTLQHYEWNAVLDATAMMDVSRAKGGVEWLERNCRQINYDNHSLIPASLYSAVAWYLAIKDLFRDTETSFCVFSPLGGENELLAALFNDGSDWEGDKTPISCPSPYDTNGALTMRLLSLVSGTPILKARIAGRHKQNGVFRLHVPGANAPFLSRRAGNPVENWQTVSLHPDTRRRSAEPLLRFPIAPAPEVTFARITRRAGRFRCLLVRGELLGRPDGTGPVPARFHCDPNAFLDACASGHIHAAAGDHFGAMKAACESLDIETVLLR